MSAAFIRKRVVDLLRPRQSPPQSIDEHPHEEQEEEETNGFSLLAHLYLTGFGGHSVKVPELYFGKTGCDLPLLQIAELEDEVVCACTGPEGGLSNVEGVREEKIAKMVNLDDEMCLSTDGMDTDDEDEDKTSRISSSLSLDTHCISNGNVKTKSIKTGCDNIDWNRTDEDTAFGCSSSLYEKNPLTGVSAGNPIADVYAVCARSNNAILALADGVNWGEGARLAARCAVRGAMDHINNCIIHNKLRNTNEVFHELLASFHSAHSLILQEGGMLTTLCVAIALPVANSNSWVLCVCNVGDSLCFVYNGGYGVREVTLGSHDSSEMRDMRNAGGALGPVDGRNPQLQNLTCSETFVEPGDIIFITSDGISDNFDPVVGKFCVIKKTEDLDNNALPRLSDRKLSVSAIPSSSSNGDKDSFHRTKSCAASIPCVDAIQRQHLMLLRMRDIITHGLSSIPLDGDCLSTPRLPNPYRLCSSLLQFATQLSNAKRKVLENPELYKKEKLTKSEERARRKMVRERISELPGKLDHASVVAYRVGSISPSNKCINNKRWPLSKINKEEEELPIETIEMKVNVENFTRQSRAFCETILIDNEGEKESVQLNISNKDDMNVSPRATSPYEEIKMDNRNIGKHERGSRGRHTLSVDVAWLKKLVTRKDKDDKIKIEDDESRSFSKRFRGLLSSNKNIPDTVEVVPSSSSSTTLPHHPNQSIRCPRPINNRSQSSVGQSIPRNFHVTSSVSHL